MKRYLFFACFLCLSLSASAQTTWFSESTGASFESPWGMTAGQNAVRLSNGEILVAGAAEGAVLELSRFGPSGEIISTHVQPSSRPAFMFITGAQTMDDEAALLISGVGTTDSASWGSVENGFFLARIDLATYEVKVSFRLWMGGDPYIYAPSVSVTPDAIYEGFPFYSQAMTARLDHDLNALWCKSLIPEPGDTMFSKHPSMGSFFCDSTIIVSCKAGNSLALARLSPSGDFVSYRRFTNLGYTRIYGINGTADGNLLLTGFYESYPVIIKMTPEGVPFWAKTIGGGEIYTFVNAYELPDGRIIAIGRNADTNRKEVNRYCLFDASGNLLSAGGFGTGVDQYSLQNMSFCEDGILAAGSVVNLMSGDFYDVLQFTDFNFGQACHPAPVAATAANHNLGVVTDLAEADVAVWNSPAPAPLPFTFTMASSITENPVVCNLATSVNTTETKSFSIYPNPVFSGDKVNISLPAAGEYTATLSDITGKILLTQNVTASHNGMITDHIAPGVYVITVREGDQVLGSEKLLVR